MLDNLLFCSIPKLNVILHSFVAYTLLLPASLYPCFYIDHLEVCKCNQHMSLEVSSQLEKQKIHYILIVVAHLSRVNC